MPNLPENPRPPEESTSAEPQPLRDGDTSIEPDPASDAAQSEWDGVDESEATATGDDPAHVPSDEDDVPASDLPGAAAEPDTQGQDPTAAELGDAGQGDLAPEDL